MKNQISILAASLILGLSFIAGCLIINSGKAEEARIDQVKTEAQTGLQITDKPLLTLQETAELLGLKEEQVLNIIKAEHSILNNNGSFTGMMLPYIKMDENFLINRAELLNWIESATSEKRVYNGIKVYK
ncbi:hypothetical protein [Paenibacillus sp. BAC0078]